jgi:hypothetical protein
MKRTVGFAAVLSLVGSVASAQPTTKGVAAGLGYEVVFGHAAVETSGTAVRLTVDFRPLAEAAAPARLDLTSLTPEASRSWTVEGQNSLTLSYGQPKASSERRGDVNWVGLLSEQLRIDAIFHFKRMTEPKTRLHTDHYGYFKGYVEAVQGYVEHGPRWSDGDPFLINNVNHPIMGSISSHVYMNNDRRCSAVGYGEPGYWSCLRRATVYAVIASANWEFNPLLSESALGHVGKAHTCVNGKCTGEGGWTDFVMTPFGGLGFSLVGDIARAKLWPKLDRHLSGNIAARILKNVIKVASDPGGMANAAFNLNFRGAFSSPVYTGRR